MTIIRLPEWGRQKVELSHDQRQLLSALARAWQQAHHLPKPPLHFEGIDGEVLVAQQYVGVIETADVSVEIYPKLDKDLAENDALSSDQARSVLDSLLWLLEVSGYEQLVETGAGSLTESVEAFPDLFALLMARRLREELTLGVPRRYERFEDDLPAIRGRLLVGQQATRNFNRWDKIACGFDEFTADSPFCRVLRCACRELHHRVRHVEAGRVLTDCLGLLDEVSDISVPEALHQVDFLPPWHRGIERFRRPFTLGVRLLRGLSHELSVGEGETFVFLLDMNKVFESYAAAALEACFGARVETQKYLGTLLDISPGGIQQKADFYWTEPSGRVWIGDAKYKDLAQGQVSSLTFEADDTIAAGKCLSPDDVRQLTVYAELDRRRTGDTSTRELVLLYPFVGEGTFMATSVKAWNGSTLWLLPLRMKRSTNLAKVLPPLNPHSSV